METKLQTITRKLLTWADFLGFYAREVALSNFKVAYDVVTPSLLAEPGLLELDLSPDLTDTQIMMLANLITMTPGTLSIDVSEDRRILLIHGMYLNDRESVYASLKNDFERRIRHVF